MGSAGREQACNAAGRASMHGRCLPAATPWYAPASRDQDNWQPRKTECWLRGGGRPSSCNSVAAAAGSVSMRPRVSEDGGCGWRGGWRCRHGRGGVALPSPLSSPPQTDIARLDQGACIPLRRPYRPPGLARDGASPHVERGLRRGRPPPPTWCPAHSAGRPPPLPSGVHTALRCWSASWPPGGRWWAGVAPGAGGRLGVSPSTPWTFAVPEIADGILTDGCRGQGRSCAR